MKNERARLLRRMERLAGCRVNDAVKLAFLDGEQLGEIDGLDLGALKEFKRSGNGAVELKLVDRAAVLERLGGPGGRGGGVFPGAAGERRCGLGPFPGSRGVCSPGGVPPRGKAGRRLFATERYAAERPCAWGWPSSCGPRPASTAWPSGCAAKPSRRCGATCCGRCCLRWGRWGSSGGSRHPKTG